MTSRGRWLAWILSTGFAARVAIRLAGGEAAYLENSYGFYRAIAASFVSGTGLCFAANDCARRPPLYSIFLSPFVALDAVYPAAVIAQAGVGVLLAWLVFHLARDLYDARTGLLAAVMAAFSPYAVLHDTALQETVLVNTLLVGAAVCLLRWRRTGSLRTGVGAGVLLGLATLTTTRVGLMCACAVGWAFVGRRSFPSVAGKALPVVLSAAVVVGAWSLRNWIVVGVPVQSTEAGAALWFGNNEWTFKYFPERSIDVARWEARASLPPPIQESFGQDPVADDRYLRHLGVQYIRQHPLDTAIGAARKLWVVVSADLSPARSRLLDLGYRLVYLSIHALAVVAMWRDLRQRTSHGLIVGILLAFAVTTAIYWAHTSHKSVIDAFLFVYAAATLSRTFPERRAIQ